jgi:hypothetical protein
VPVASLEVMEDGGELLREREEPALGGRLGIAQGMNEAVGGKTSSGDTGGEPGLVDLREEAGDLVPAGALTGLAGIADEHDIEVETVAGGIDHAVGSAADEVAEDGEKLEKQGGGMGLGVGRDGADGEPGDAVKGGGVEIGMRGGAGGLGGLRNLGRVGLRRLGGRFGLRELGRIEEFGPVLLHLVEVREAWTAEAHGGVSFHEVTLLRFRLAVENRWSPREKVTLWGEKL